MKYLISLFKSLFRKKPPRNTVIGKPLDDIPHITGNDSTPIGGKNLGLDTDTGELCKNRGVGHQAGHCPNVGIGYFEPFHNIGSKPKKIKFSKS